MAQGRCVRSIGYVVHFPGFLCEQWEMWACRNICGCFDALLTRDYCKQLKASWGLGKAQNQAGVTVELETCHVRIMHPSCKQRIWVGDKYTGRPDEACTTHTTHAWHSSKELVTYAQVVLLKKPVFTTVCVHSLHNADMTHSHLARICESNVRIMCAYMMLAWALSLISF